MLNLLSRQDHAKPEESDIINLIISSSFSYKKRQELKVVDSLFISGNLF